MYRVFGKNRYLPRAILEIILFGFVELLLIFLLVELGAQEKYGPMSLMLVTSAFVGVFALDMVGPVRFMCVVFQKLSRNSCHYL